jgi:hypothetical protein
MAILGALSMVAGIAVLLWSIRRLGESPRVANQSLLAPTLAVDTLDADLRVLYMRTLVLDAHCQAAYGDERSSEWSPLGRELRRAVVAMQARRVQGNPEEPADAIEQIIERAIEHAHDEAGLDDEWETLRSEAARHTRPRG